MPTIRLQTVINRWTEGSFFAYNSSLAPAPTIDDVHRRIIAKGTFDKNDLNNIVSHYTNVDPANIRTHAGLINKLYRRLDDVGQFTGLKPDYHLRSDPTLRFGSCGNDKSDEDYFSATRYDNAGYDQPEDTGYEIEFLTGEGWSTITLKDHTSPTP
jgi:hypothetical protein|tara:strand:+ start:868 stop:1335 length:468 start_codon:yes stop_codon:yes gene_type:complete